MQFHFRRPGFPSFFVNKSVQLIEVLHGGVAGNWFEIVNGLGVPAILMGASSSSRLGWRMNTSLEAAQSCRISPSPSCTCCTCFPGRHRRTSRRRRIKSSRAMRFIDPPAGRANQASWSYLGWHTRVCILDRSNCRSMLISRR
jgi:hypothetical protein